MIEGQKKQCELEQANISVNFIRFLLALPIGISPLVGLSVDYCVIPKSV
jgi:hypothetical protein